MSSGISFTNTQTDSVFSSSVFSSIKTKSADFINNSDWSSNSLVNFTKNNLFNTTNEDHNTIDVLEELGLKIQDGKFNIFFVKYFKVLSALVSPVIHNLNLVFYEANFRKDNITCLLLLGKDLLKHLKFLRFMDFPRLSYFYDSDSELIINHSRIFNSIEKVLSFYNRDLWINIIDYFNESISILTHHIDETITLIPSRFIFFREEEYCQYFVSISADDEELLEDRFNLLESIFGDEETTSLFNDAYGMSMAQRFFLKNEYFVEETIPNMSTENHLFLNIEVEIPMKKSNNNLSKLVQKYFKSKHYDKILPFNIPRITNSQIIRRHLFNKTFHETKYHHYKLSESPDVYKHFNKIFTMSSDSSDLSDLLDRVYVLIYANKFNCVRCLKSLYHNKLETKGRFDNYTILTNVIDKLSQTEFGELTQHPLQETWFILTNLYDYFINRFLCIDCFGYRLENPLERPSVNHCYMIYPSVIFTLNEPHVFLDDPLPISKWSEDYLKANACIPYYSHSDILKIKDESLYLVLYQWYFLRFIWYSYLSILVNKSKFIHSDIKSFLSMVLKLCHYDNFNNNSNKLSFSEATGVFLSTLSDEDSIDDVATNLYKTHPLKRVIENYSKAYAMTNDVNNNHLHSFIYKTKCTICQNVISDGLFKCGSDFSINSFHCVNCGVFGHLECIHNIQSIYAKDKQNSTMCPMCDSPHF